MLDAKKALAIAQQYTDESLAGAGALKGAPCQIQSIDEITGGNRITFLWVDNNGDSHTSILNVMDGVKGDKGDRGEVGERGATGSKGDSSTIRIGSVTSGASPSVENVGTNTDAVFDIVLPKGDRGEKGDRGNDGQDGKSFDIKAKYPNYNALIAEHPTGEAGDAYFVGADGNPDLYVWLTESQEWMNNGKIAGVKGDKGDTGDEGFSPVASVSKVGKVATISIRDKVGQTIETVSDGEDGKDAQFLTLPEANATNEGRICQYIGQTSGNLVNGHFYKCVEESGSFYWVELFGSAIDKDATDKVAPNNHALVESNAVYSAINNALSSIYTPRGELTCAELTASLLIAENVGNVYEMSDAGTTSALFLQGAGVPIAIGDNVGIIQTGADTYKFNLMANAFDLTDYQKKDLTTFITVGGASQTTVEGALGALNTVKQDKTLETPLTIGGEQKTTVEGALSALNDAHEIIVETVEPNGTRTFKDALSIFASAYANLTHAQKLNSYIRSGAGAKYTFISGTQTTAVYNHAHVQGTDLFVSRTFNVSNTYANNVYREAQLRAGGVTFPDYSTTVLGTTYYLCYSH